MKSIMGFYFREDVSLIKIIHMTHKTITLVLRCSNIGWYVGYLIINKFNPNDRTYKMFFLLFRRVAIE